jgi:type III restriction enzyme
MKFTLNDYQDQAYQETFVNLVKARRRWRAEKDRHSFSLTAPTGAGKTVMAAAVFEALFHGDALYGFDPDPGAVVIWFSDDPALNEQTRYRLMECANRLHADALVPVGTSFSRPRFEPGKIYFLNSQKLSKNSLLVRGFDNDSDGGMFPETKPDMHQYTIWETIRNTIEDPELTLYLVLDEAHRGMGKLSTSEQSEKSTIVKRLINGEKGVPGVPIVLGISATVERFNKAMAVAQGRDKLQNVIVEPYKVQDSGLLKDSIGLEIPAEDGKFRSSLVRRAADKLKESSFAWSAYTAAQGGTESVTPLLLLQVENKPDPAEIGRDLDIIFEQWKGIPENCVAHVFGDHIELKFGRHSVPYISPDRVQESTWIRVLIAKEAISTGWDCPRAEVMVSFRGAQDRTYITQLLGRMVRSPLARRIAGNDRLNSVDCLLPFFNEATVKKVVEGLQLGDDTTPAISRILINPQDMTPNTEVSNDVWSKFTSLPSQTRPQRGAKPPIRLTALAHELAMDALLPDAGSLAHMEMHQFLDKFIVERASDFSEMKKAVTTVEGRTVLADMRGKESTSTTFQMAADGIVIDDAYRRVQRILSPDIAKTYTELRASRHDDAEDDFEAALIEAREEIGALGLMENLQQLFDIAAKELSDNWLNEYGHQIKQLPDERQDAYRQITALSREAQAIDLAMPLTRREATMIRESDGREEKLPSYRAHLLSDEKSMYPSELKGWERAVLEKEMGRDEFKFWYRNPDRPSQDSLGIAYEVEGDIKLMRPDFLFFSALPSGEVVVDIIDPHGHHLADALPKLQGLADYAEKFGANYRRIEAVADGGSGLRRLDMTKPEVRSAVRSASTAEGLYKSATAGDYS